MTDNPQPEALRLADELEREKWHVPAVVLQTATEELRRQHARIAELEAALEAIGAGGVSGPLMGCASIAASAGSEPVAHLWQHSETGRTRVVMPDMVVDACATWLLVGPLYLHPSPPEGMVGGWMPIETAPKDGTAILLGSRGGSWIGKWLPVYVSGYRPENPWSSLMLNHDHMGEKWVKPTHWMPLPPPPTTSAGSGKGE